jgi:hypothetical protein
MLTLTCESTATMLIIYRHTTGKGKVKACCMVLGKNSTIVDHFLHKFYGAAVF